MLGAAPARVASVVRHPDFDERAGLANPVHFLHYRDGVGQVLHYVLQVDFLERVVGQGVGKLSQVPDQVGLELLDDVHAEGALPARGAAAQVEYFLAVQVGLRKAFFRVIEQFRRRITIVAASFNKVSCARLSMEKRILASVILPVYKTRTLF